MSGGRVVVKQQFCYLNGEGFVKVEDTISITPPNSAREVLHFSIDTEQNLVPLMGYHTLNRKCARAFNVSQIKEQRNPLISKHESLLAAFSEANCGVVDGKVVNFEDFFLFLNEKYFKPLQNDNGIYSCVVDKEKFRKLFERGHQIIGANGHGAKAHRNITAARLLHYLNEYKEWLQARSQKDDEFTQMMQLFLSEDSEAQSVHPATSISLAAADEDDDLDFATIFNQPLLPMFSNKRSRDDGNENVRQNKAVRLIR